MWPKLSIREIGFESEGEEYNAEETNSDKKEPEVDLLDQKLFGGQALDENGDELIQGPDGAIDVESSEDPNKKDVKVKRKRIKLKLDEERLTNGIENLAPYFCQTFTESDTSPNDEYPDTTCKRYQWRTKHTNTHLHNKPIWW